MSRTYRKTGWSIRICNNCNKPVSRWAKYTVEHGKDLCECPHDVVTMKTVYWRETRNGITKKVKWEWDQQLPNSEREVFDYRVWDGHQIRSACRKDYQQARNRSYRNKVKQVLTDRTTPYEDMVFPVVKKEVDWDVW